MHILEPIHTQLSSEESDELLNKLNISSAQLPKIKINDPSIPSDCKVGTIIKIERTSHGRKFFYYRVVSV